MMKRSFEFYWMAYNIDDHNGEKNNRIILFAQYVNRYPDDHRSIAIGTSSLYHGGIQYMYGDWPGMNEYLEEDELDMWYDTELL